MPDAARFVHRHVGGTTTRIARPFIPRASDRIRCFREGHDWAGSRVLLGEVVLMRSECARCGKVGRVRSVCHPSDPALSSGDAANSA